MSDKNLLDIRFVKIENLRGRAKLKAEENGWKDGLAILKTTTGSLPEYEVEKVFGDPIDAIRKIGENEGITQSILDKALEDTSEEPES